jgi:hypothetical protein
MFAQLWESNSRAGRHHSAHGKTGASRVLRSNDDQRVLQIRGDPPTKLDDPRDAELATLDWIAWLNHHRWPALLGYIAPEMPEANYYRDLTDQASATV